MKKIKVKFVDFWNNFDPFTNIIYISLCKNFEVELSEEPDYVIFSCFGDEHLKYDAIKIFYTGENICPDFNLCDYAIGFEYMEYGDRYLRYPFFLQYDFKNQIDMMDNRLKLEKKDVLNKGFCSFVVSNSNANPIREKFFDELSKYKEIKSGGRFRNNVGGPVKDKLEFQRQYKFCLSFENSSHPGYTTEKIMQAFASDAIPIYWGDPLVDKYFNPKSFIWIKDESGINEAIKKIKFLDENIDEYMKMLNEHPLIEKNIYEEYTKKLEDFLYNICSQNLKDALRFSRECTGKLYYEKQLELKKMNEKFIYVNSKKIKRLFR